MSNRLRVLFHCDLDGNRAFVGAGALKRMQDLAMEIQGPPRLVDKATWISLGRPPFRERKLSYNVLGRPEFLYLLDTQKPAQSPLELSLSAQSARLLWNRLPVDVRKISHLMVLRENRRHSWRHSQANPRRHGWVVCKDPAMLRSVAPIPTAGPTFSNITVTGSPLESLDFVDPPEPSWKAKINTAKYAWAAPDGVIKPKKKPKYIPPVAGQQGAEGEPSGPSGPSTAKPKLRIGIWS